MATTTATASKPTLVPALRSTWRKSAQHTAEQVKRFLRLFALSAIPAIVSLSMSGSHFDKKTLIALLVPIGETAYRQVFPALGAEKADEAPGVTIVPEQVIDTTDPTAPVSSVDPPG